MKKKHIDENFIIFLRIFVAFHFLGRRMGSGAGEEGRN